MEWVSRMEEDLTQPVGPERLKNLLLSKKEDLWKTGTSHAHATAKDSQRLFRVLELLSEDDRTARWIEQHIPHVWFMEVVNQAPSTIQAELLNSCFAVYQNIGRHKTLPQNEYHAWVHVWDTHISQTKPVLKSTLAHRVWLWQSRITSPAPPWDTWDISPATLYALSKTASFPEYYHTPATEVKPSSEAWLWSVAVSFSDGRAYEWANFLVDHSVLTYVRPDYPDHAGVLRDVRRLSARIQAVKPPEYLAQMPAGYVREYLAKQCPVAEAVYVLKHQGIFLENRLPEGARWMTLMYDDPTDFWSHYHHPEQHQLPAGLSAMGEQETVSFD